MKKDLLLEGSCLHGFSRGVSLWSMNYLQLYFRESLALTNWMIVYFLDTYFLIMKKKASGSQTLSPLTLPLLHSVAK